MGSFSGANPPSTRLVTPPPVPPHRVATGVRALLFGLYVLATGIISLVKVATEVPHHAPATFGPKVTVLDLVLFVCGVLIGTPICGIASFVLASANAERHRGARGTALGRWLSRFAVAATLLGWALFPLCLFVNSTRRR